MVTVLGPAKFIIKAEDAFVVRINSVTLGWYNVRSPLLYDTLQCTPPLACLLTYADYH